MTEILFTVTLSLNTIKLKSKYTVNVVIVLSIIDQIRPTDSR